MYSVIVSFGVIVSFCFSVFIAKGIFGAHATWPAFAAHALLQLAACFCCLAATLGFYDVCYYFGVSVVFFEIGR